MPSAQNLRAANDAANPNDLAAWWLPFTSNRAFKARPRLISGAKGMHYYTPDGRAILDGAAGLWCCNAGHNRDEIVAAIQQQAADLDFAPAFQFGHPKAFTLASRIAELAPGDLDHVGEEGDEPRRVPERLARDDAREGGAEGLDLVGGIDALLRLGGTSGRHSMS